MKRKIGAFDIIVYLLYISLFKTYFIPDTVRQIIKLVGTITVFIFLITRLPKRKLLNVSILFGVCVIASSLYNFITTNYRATSLFDAVSYSICFYDLYTLCLYANFKGVTKRLVKCMYNITSIYCVVSFVAGLVVSTRNNGNIAVYPFGTKFTTSYFFLMYFALYLCTHKIEKRNEKAWLVIFALLTLWLTLHIGCATATIAFLIEIIIFVFTVRLKKIILKPQVVVISLIVSGLILLVIDRILSIHFVSDIVYGYFNRSYTVSGRLEIYDVYIGRLIGGSPLLGYGRDSGIMYSTSRGMFANAQNGIIDIIINYGVLGGIALIYTLYSCFRHSPNNSSNYYASLIVYAMIVAAVFEVTINWFFFIGMCLVRWISFENEISFSKNIYKNGRLISHETNKYFRRNSKY